MNLTQGETLRLSIPGTDDPQVEFRFGGASVIPAIPATLTDGAWTAWLGTDYLEPGRYVWQAWAMDGDGGKRVLRSDGFSIAAPLDEGDVRSLARKMVEMIESQMAGNASEGVRRYRINNRELERYSVAELLSLLSYWKNQLRIEERRARGQSALGPRIEFRI
jgi:hypothetical protein